MYKYKRIIGKVLLGVLVLSIMIPLFPALLVKADPIGEIELNVGTDYDNITIQPVDGFWVGYNKIHPDYKGSILTKDEYKDSGSNICTNFYDNGSGSSGKILEAYGDIPSTNSDYDAKYEGTLYPSFEKGYLNLKDFLQGIRVKNTDGDSSPLMSINGIQLNDLDTALCKSLGYDNTGEAEPDLIMIYHKVLIPASDGISDTIYMFIACDYRISTEEYVYYTATTARESLVADNLMVAVFTSKSYILPAFNKTIIKEGDVAKSVISSEMSSENDKDYKSNIINLCRALGIKDTKTIFTEIANDPKLVAKYKSNIEAYDNILHYENNTVSCYSDYFIYPSKSSKNGIFFGMAIGPDVIIKTQKGDKIENKTFLFNEPFEINDRLIAWGDVNETSGQKVFRVEEAGENVKGLAEICAGILNDIANANPEDATKASENILDAMRDNGISQTGFVYTLIDKYQKKLNEAITKQSIDQITEGGEFLGLPNNASNYQILTAICKQSIISSVAKTPLPKYVKINNETYVIDSTINGGETYEYTDDNGISIKKPSIKEMYNSLTGYQKAMLTEAYYNKLASLAIDSSNPAIINYIKGKRSEDSLDIQYEFNELGPGGKPDEATPEYTNQLIKNYNESDLFNTGSVTNVARNANVLAHYVVTSALYNNSDAMATDPNAFYSVYNTNLESLIKVQWTYKNGIDTDYQQDYFSVLPSASKLFGDEESKYTVMFGSHINWERFTNLMFNVEYAFSTLAFSEYGNDLGSVPSDIQEFVESGKGQEVVDWLEKNYNMSEFEQVSLQNEDFDNDSFSINIFRSVIELWDMCQFLGIDVGDWSTTINMYLQLYKENEPFFNILRGNTNIYKKLNQQAQSPEEPLAMFFTLQDKKVSDNWARGFACSALFVPMETNIYDANAVSFNSDPEWVSEFYYKYAFYRKALYINTNNSAIVNKFVYGSSSGSRVATLNDLLNYDRDIILTIDDNFYNANEISSVISKLDYTGMRNTVNTADTAEGWDAVKGQISDLMDLSADQVLKTGPTSYYSTALANNVTKFGEERDKLNLTAYMLDAYVLTQEDLVGDKNVFDEYEYSPKQSYGVVSSVYRSPELYNECLRALASDNAIFKSSKDICKTPGTTSSEWRSLYNYTMLANLSEQMKNDTASTLDLDAPIFCDLFGNIVTESGLIIIPAAANATLTGTNWNPYTVGWSEYYNNGNRIEVGEFTDEVYTWLVGRSYTSTYASESNDGNNLFASGGTNALISQSDYIDKKNAGGFFEIDPSGQLILRTTQLTSNNLTGIVQWDILNKNSTIIKQLFFNDAYFNKAAKMYSYRISNLIIEVMRGAPIEFIDYTFEGLDGNQNISKYGVYMAYKLEELLNMMMPSTNGSVTGGNSVVTMPNLAFMPGVEYIMLYAFKIVFAILIVGLVIQLYLDAVKNHLGIKSVGKFLVTCVMVFLAFTVLPTLVTWSYYNANKTLLTEETGYISMLNYVKQFDGTEIGITKVSTPETQTELYIKLDDVSIQWWSVIGDVLFGNTYKSVSELYKAQAEDHPYASQKDIVVKGDGMYMSVQDIYDSTDLDYRPTSARLVNNVYTYGTSGALATNAPVSYTMPYYVFLDQLIANINEYNASRDISTYSWTVGSNGHIMTYDIITPYLHSDEFLAEGLDILGLNRILETENYPPAYAYAFDTNQVERMKLSLWYPKEAVTNSMRITNTNKLYKFAREYIAKNADVLGKIPDEVFLKVMAIELAIEYNKLFNVSYGRSMEIMNIDTRDIMRFMVADNEAVYKYYSYSFARFTYEEAGGIGVVFAAILLTVLWLTGFIKPLAMILILALLIINCVFRKVLFRKESRCIEGYLIGSACLVLCNYAYALMLRISLSICGLGLGAILSLVIGLIVQIAYVFLLCMIMVIEVKDWKNSGFNEFLTIGSSITSKIMKAQNVIADKIVSRHSEAYKETARSRNYTGNEYDRESIDAMHQRDEEREENGTYNIS